MPDVSPIRFALLAACLLLFGGTNGLAAERVPLKLGTASESEVYFAPGRGICRALNAKPDAFGIDCEAVETPGSVYNLDALRDGDFQLAIAQSDW